MQPDTLQNGVAAILRGDTEFMDLIPGGVWTRRVRRNENPPDIAPTPGSTPDAFDHAGRILRCVSILNGGGSLDITGPDGANLSMVRLFLRCLPHETEKAKMNLAALRAIHLLKGAVVPLIGGGAARLAVVSRMMPDDDPDIGPAMVDMIEVQAASVWT